jgi:hypothetical protein
MMCTSAFNKMPVQCYTIYEESSRSSVAAVNADIDFDDSSCSVDESFDFGNGNDVYYYSSYYYNRCYYGYYLSYDGGHYYDDTMAPVISESEVTGLAMWMMDTKQSWDEGYFYYPNDTMVAASTPTPSPKPPTPPTPVKPEPEPEPEPLDGTGEEQELALWRSGAYAKLAKFVSDQIERGLPVSQDCVQAVDDYMKQRTEPVQAVGDYAKPGAMPDVKPNTEPAPSSSVLSV